MTIRKLSECRLGTSWFRASLAAFAILGLFSVTASAAAGPAGSKTLQGVLLDKESSPNAETRIVSGASPHLEGGMLWAYTHKRTELLAPSARRSGYGILAYETNKYFTFDPAGNAKALALIEGTKKEDDMRIEVTGEVQGDTIRVNAIKLLP
jgi:hypothetical protein